MLTKTLALIALAALLFASLPATAAEASYLVSRDIFYGAKPGPDRKLQSLDLYWKDNLRKRPVIIYVHDGAWALGDKAEVHKKPAFFSHHDIAFVSMNYRLRWESSLVDQLEDIVAVIRWVRSKREQYGFDPTRVVLMGHGAGAHLVSLVATQPAYLDTRGIDFDHIRAVVAINSSSFDIENLMTESGSFLDKRRHRLIFGEEIKAWRAASPLHHVAAGKRIPPFALLYVPSEEAVVLQTRAFARALRGADVNVIMIPANDRTPQTIDEEIGASRDAPTLALIAFVRAAL